MDFIGVDLRPEHWRLKQQLLLFQLIGHSIPQFSSRANLNLNALCDKYFFDSKSLKRLVARHVTPKQCKQTNSLSRQCKSHLLLLLQLLYKLILVSFGSSLFLENKLAPKPFPEAMTIIVSSRRAEPLFHCSTSLKMMLITGAESDHAYDSQCFKEVIIP